MTNKLYFMEPSETLEQLKQYYFPPYITLAHMFHAPNGWKLKPRSLKQYQLQYVVEGVADYHISGHDYVTERGDLIFHRPTEPHYITTRQNEPYVCISIVFHFGDTGFPIHQVIDASNEIGPHYMGNYQNHTIEHKLTELVHHYRMPEVTDHFLCQSLLTQVLLQMNKQKKELAVSTSKKEDANKAKLILIRNYISNHLQVGFTHQDLEKLTGWSRNYIITQFRSAFGMSPGQYLVWVRLEKAKELALQSGQSFGEIANRVGYTNIHAFGKIFKRKTGMSLSQFCATLFKDTPDQ
ncbi:helix-turn-helix domain-containing protein [Paenibacillus sp. 5J-6]|uniref:Helix-turn-helix domain-containing protein n=1 Tax=Paenibacillus silvestris TaxID=2606219 RepID=A0A6L8UVA4_9BACL|nr:AraC family transcriptional regulator [Paenibacillus silvestris]MZQ82158.1 helix-turn-helix domain-containing protein [Paenibacillus silvestris]